MKKAGKKVQLGIDPHYTACSNVQTLNISYI